MRNWKNGLNIAGNLAAFVLLAVLCWPTPNVVAQPYTTLSSGARNDAVVAKALTNSGLQTILNVRTVNSNRLFITCTNTVNALSAFAVTMNQANNAATPVTLANAAGDFTTPVAPMVRASGSLVTLGVATGWFMMDTLGVDAVQIAATSSSASGSIISCWASVS